MNKLSEFPTEALLHEYRKKRYCFATPIYRYYIRYNSVIKDYEVWENVYGEYNDERLPKKYRTICLYMKISDKTREDVIKEHTVIKSKDGGCKYEYVPSEHRWRTVNYGNLMKIHFDGLYWEGQMDEIKNELANRPNVNIDGGKAWRRWLMWYKKNKKRGSK